AQSRGGDRLRSRPRGGARRPRRHRYRDAPRLSPLARRPRGLPAPARALDGGGRGVSTRPRAHGQRARAALLCGEARGVRGRRLNGRALRAAASRRSPPAATSVPRVHARPPPFEGQNNQVATFSALLNATPLFSQDSSTLPTCSPAASCASTQLINSKPVQPDARWSPTRDVYAELRGCRAKRQCE